MYAKLVLAIIYRVHGLRLVTKSVTFNDRERRNGRFALLHQIRYIWRQLAYVRVIDARPYNSAI